MFALRNQAQPWIYLLTLLAALLGGCTAAMKITLENHGALPVELNALCGDASYKASLLAAATITWQPTANACFVQIDGARNGRRLTIRNDCRHASGCSLEARQPAQGTTRLTGTGQLEIIGDLAALR